MTPEGRIAAKVGDQEYDDHCENGEVESMISFLIQKNDKLKKRQLTRSKSNQKNSELSYKRRQTLMTSIGLWMNLEQCVEDGWTMCWYLLYLHFIKV